MALGMQPDYHSNAQATKAVITITMSKGFLVLDLTTKEFTQVPTSVWN